MAASLGIGWSVKGQGAFAPAGMAQATPSAASLSGGIDPMMLMSMLGGANKGAPVGEIIAPQKNQIPMQNVDYSPSNYGDMIKTALLRQKMGM